MRRDKIWMILAAACLAVTVTACGGQKESTTEAAGDQTAEPQETKAKGTESEKAAAEFPEENAISTSILV